MTLANFLKINKEMIIKLSEETFSSDYQKVAKYLVMIQLMVNITGVKEEDPKNIAIFISSYLSLYVRRYGYDKTEDFILSRSMWENQTPNLVLSQAQLIKNLSLELLVIKGDSISKSELTLKPLFNLMSFLSQKLTNN